MTDNQTDRVEEIGFDQILERLRRVIAQLETGNLSLEESLQAYEAGVGLARRGHTLLDSAEKRVELLVRHHRDGAVVTEPLDTEAGGDRPAPASDPRTAGPRDSPAAGGRRDPGGGRRPGSAKE